MRCLRKKGIILKQICQQYRRKYRNCSYCLIRKYIAAEKVWENEKSTLTAEISTLKTQLQAANEQIADLTAKSEKKVLKATVLWDFSAGSCQRLTILTTCMTVRTENVGKYFSKHRFCGHKILNAAALSNICNCTVILRLRVSAISR